MTNDNIELVGIINSNDKLTASLSLDQDLKGNILTGQIQVSTDDHTKLRNRELANQHPIKAVEGLEQELLNIKSNAQTMLMSIKQNEEKIKSKIRTVKEVPNDMRAGEYIFLEKEEKKNG